MLAGLCQRRTPYLPRRGTGIDGETHASCENQYDVTLDWIVCFCSGPWNAPRLARRCPGEVPPAVPLLHAVLLRHAGVPEHSAGQCGLLDALRLPRIDRDGRRPRPIHPSADPPRCRRLLRRRRAIKRRASPFALAARKEGLGEEPCARSVLFCSWQ